MEKMKILIFLILLNSYAFSDQIRIKDVLDREIVLNKPVKKVIALGASLSFVTYLQARDMVVGVEYIELKYIEKRTYTYVNREWIKNIPILGRGWNPTFEAIKVLNPDIIFLINQDKHQADLLSQKLDIPVVVVGYGLDTIDFKHIYHSLEIMGKILGKEKRAEELISYIQKLKTQFKKIKNPKIAYMGAVTYRGFRGITSTKADFMPFKLVNIKNITSELQEKGQVFINKEYLLVKDPPIIFIDHIGLELVKNDFYKHPAYFYKLDAFKDKAYITLSNTFYHGNFDQMLANSFFMAKVIYPEHYKNLDPVKKADEIFTMFVGEPLYKMIEKDMGGFQKLELKNNKFHTKSI